MVTKENLEKVPENCSVHIGDLTIERMKEPPKNIAVLSKLKVIKGALIVKKTRYADLSFLKGLRCINNDKGPPIVLERNSHLKSLGLTNIESLTGDGGPVIASYGDSYLFMVSGDEIRKVIVAGNPDHMYSKDMFMLEEASVHDDTWIIVVIFAVLMVLVLAIIAVGHFVLKLHIPKSKNDSRKSKGSEASTSPSLTNSSRKSSGGSNRTPRKKRSTAGAVLLGSRSRFSTR